MLALLFAAAAAAPAAPPNGSYRYTSSMNGAAIAQTTITVARTPGGDLVLSESGSGSMNGQAGSVQDSLTLAPDLAPLAYTSLASIADSRNMRASVAFAGNQARQTGDVSIVYRLPANVSHFVLMDVGPFSGFFAIPAQMQAWNDAPVLALIPNFAQAATLTLDRALAPDRPSGVPRRDRELSFSSIVALSMWYDPATLVVDRVDVPSDGLVVTRL